MNEDFWKDKYPAGIAAQINPDEYPNIQAVLKQSCQRFANKPAFSNLGKTITYGELYELSGAFAAYLQQHTDLKPGDRIAVQLPNVLQYPVAVFGAIRAGLIVVNTNPLYTAREMEHQFNDSGAKALVCLANMAHLAEEVLPKTGIKHVIVTEVGDLLPPLKRLLVNTVGGVVQPGKEVVEIVPLDDALILEAKIAPKDIAFLRPGQKAIVKFTAYDFSIYGGLEATLENIGADSITDERGNTFYTVKVRTSKSSLGDNLPVIPGMVAEVDIVTGQKSILAYLLKPVLKAKQAAFTER